MPPRLDSPDKADRLVAWLRLRPTGDLESLGVSWVGINAVEIDQRQTVTGRIIGQSDGAAYQTMQLPGTPVEEATLQLQVEETGRGYQLWQRVDDLSLSGRDDGHYQLDPEAGTIRFGDGIRGRVPTVGARVRVAQMRIGGGSGGNLPSGTLTKINALALDGGVVTTKLKVVQKLATEGGKEPESLAEAEQRIPALFRHRDRAVTVEDYQQLAASARGVRLGRVEVLPRFKPHQRRENVPGFVSVMVLPQKDGYEPPYPRPDRPLLETVHAHLNERRPLGTELYVIGCEYVPIGLSVAITIVGDDRASLSLGGVYGQRNDLTAPGPDQVTNEVIAALREYLWPLAPGGTHGVGWERGRSVRDRELEVVVARVPGVDTVSQVNLFELRGEDWQLVERPIPDARVQITLEPYQLPELLALSVSIGTDPATTITSPIDPFAGDGIAVPVVPKVC
jgi:predicted phage baseplate assembly protein